MIVLGLTGSIGMGKTVTARMLARLGLPVCDSDAVVHRLMGKGGRAVAAVEAAFPGSAVNGVIDRRILGGKVFGNAGELTRLEAILHPLVRDEQRRFLASCAARRKRIAVLDIPLLFETGGEDRVDYLAVVSAPRFIQRARVLRRPGMTPKRLDSILAKQMPDREKRRRADYVIPSGLGRRVALAAVVAMVNDLRTRPGRVWPDAWQQGKKRSCAKSSLIPKPRASTRSPATASSRSAPSS